MLLLGFFKLYLGSWLVTVVYKILTFWLVWWFSILPIVSKTAGVYMLFTHALDLVSVFLKDTFSDFEAKYLKKIEHDGHMISSWKKHALLEKC